MPEDYLWDGQGPADAESASMEQLLRPLAFGEPRKRNRARKAAVMVSAFLLCVGGLSLLRPGRPTVWRMDGSPQPIAAGKVLDSGNSKIELEAESVGHVQLDAGSRLRVTSSAPDRQVLNLEYGTMHALIWAQPGQFAVDTPSARTVDLGCAYTITTRRDGRGLLNVETGWVAFQAGQVESFIPAGAMCRTRPRTGPGTPYFTDASSEFQAAVDQFDETGAAAPLKLLLADARSHDALTLWHLLKRSHDSRGLVYDRLASLVTLPPSVTREGILEANVGMLDQTWNALELGETDWWRSWKRQWPSR